MLRPLLALALALTLTLALALALALVLSMLCICMHALVHYITNSNAHEYMDVCEGQLMFNLTGGASSNSEKRTCSFNPDGVLLATGSASGAIELWDTTGSSFQEPPAVSPTRHVVALALTLELALRLHSPYPRRCCE